MFTPLWLVVSDKYTPRLWTIIFVICDAIVLAKIIVDIAARVVGVNALISGAIIYLVMWLLVFRVSR